MQNLMCIKEAKHGMNVQTLIQTVIANNSEEHKVSVNGLSSKEELQTYSNQIELTKQYNVTLEKDTSGYINSIKIAE